MKKLKHNCISPDGATFEDETVLIHPVTKRRIAVDHCLADEVQSLWEEGIETEWVCCGHNRVDGIIIVAESSVEDMKRLGYVVHPNKYDNNRQDGFYPRFLSTRTGPSHPPDRI